ncbi:ankyrin [Thozetella sp. PMI_491]|nr:ankyrin [Thozetella sp. PMI_491]
MGSRTALWHAVAGQSLETTKQLLDYGAKVDEPDNIGRTPLHIACLVGDAAMITLLLQQGASLGLRTRAPRFTPLQLVALFGHAECLTILLRHHAMQNDGDQHQPGDVQNSPMHLAAANGWLECVQVLFEHGLGLEMYKRSAHLVLLNPYADYGCASVLHGSMTDAIEAARFCHNESVLAYLESQKMEHKVPPQAALESLQALLLAKKRENEKAISTD